MNVVSIHTSDGDDCGLPKYDEDEISKIVYPETTESMTENEFVEKAVRGRWVWVGWLLLAGLGFGVFMAACTQVAEYLIK